MTYDNYSKFGMFVLDYNTPHDVCISEDKRLTPFDELDDGKEFSVTTRLRIRDIAFTGFIMQSFVDTCLVKFPNAELIQFSECKMDNQVLDIFFNGIHSTKCADVHIEYCELPADLEIKTSFDGRLLLRQYRNTTTTRINIECYNLKELYLDSDEEETMNTVNIFCPSLNLMRMSCNPKVTSIGYIEFCSNLRKIYLTSPGFRELAENIRMVLPIANVRGRKHWKDSFVIFGDDSVF
jgi:hypothetical protein